MKDLKDIIEKFYAQNKGKTFPTIESVKKDLEYLDTLAVYSWNDILILSRIQEEGRNHGDLTTGFIEHLQTMSWINLCIIIASFYTDKVNSGSHKNGLNWILNAIKTQNKELINVCELLENFIKNNESFKNIITHRNKLVHEYKIGFKFEGKGVTKEDVETIWNTTNSLVMFVKWIAGVGDDCFTRRVGSDGHIEGIIKFLFDGLEEMNKIQQVKPVKK